MDIQDLMKHTLDQSILIPSEVRSVMMWRCARERNAPASPVTALLPYLGGVIAVNKLMFTLAEYVRHAATAADHLQTRVIQLSYRYTLILQLFQKPNQCQWRSSWTSFLTCLNIGSAKCEVKAVVGAFSKKGNNNNIVHRCQHWRTL